MINCQMLYWAYSWIFITWLRSWENSQWRSCKKVIPLCQYLLILLQSVPVLIELAPFPAHAQQITWFGCHLIPTATILLRTWGLLLIAAIVVALLTACSHWKPMAKRFSSHGCRRELFWLLLCLWGTNNWPMYWLDLLSYWKFTTRTASMQAAKISVAFSSAKCESESERWWRTFESPSGELRCAASFCF